MKYLKDAEMDVQSIIDNINDILIDLTDENEWDMKNNDISSRSNGWKVSVKAVGPLRNYDDKLGILITIGKGEGFIRKQSEEVSERIDDYLNSLGYKNKSNKFDGYSLELLYRWNMKHLKKYEGFLDIFRKKKPQPPKASIDYDEKASIDYDEVITLSKDSFAELVDNGWTVNNKYLEFPYVQITKDKLLKRKVLQEVPYKFIDVKDDVLSFCDRVMELGVKVEFAYVYENGDKPALGLLSGLSCDKPTYDDLNNGLYDNREVNILTIYLKGIEDAWKKH